MKSRLEVDFGICWSWVKWPESILKNMFIIQDDDSTIALFSPHIFEIWLQFEIQDSRTVDYSSLKILIDPFFLFFLFLEFFLGLALLFFWHDFFCYKNKLQITSKTSQKGLSIFFILTETTGTWREGKWLAFFFFEIFFSLI